MATLATPSEPIFLAHLDMARRDGVWLRQNACSRYGVGRVRAELAARRWQAPVSSVVITHNGQLTPDQRMWVVLLAAPRGTVLFGLSGAVYDGLRGFDPDTLSVVAPGSSYDPRQGELDLPDDWNVRLRWSTKLGPADVNPAAVPPRTRLARRVIDEASQRIPERRSRALVLATVQQRRVSTAGFWDALSRRGRCRNRAILVESIRDAEGGIESLPEREFDGCDAGCTFRSPVVSRWSDDGMDATSSTTSGRRSASARRSTESLIRRSASGTTTCCAKTTSASREAR